MDILVFDDNAIHRRAAQAILKGHNLTVVGTYDEAQQAIRTTKFDVVMTDLLVPVPDNLCHTTKAKAFAGQEMPLGTTIALLALAFGTKMVAVVTDSDHHSHPASAALDAFARYGFPVGDAKVLCLNAEACRYLDAETYEDAGDRREGVVWAKAWDRALDKLLEPVEQREPKPPSNSGF